MVKRAIERTVNLLSFVRAVVAKVVEVSGASLLAGGVVALMGFSIVDVQVC